MTPEEKLRKIRSVIEFNYGDAMNMGISPPEPIMRILKIIDSSKQTIRKEVFVERRMGGEKS